MTKKSLIVSLLCVLCAGVVLRAARNKDVTYMLKGTQASAHVMVTLTDGNFVNAWIDPSPLPDGSMGYLVEIIWNPAGGGYDDYNEIGGLVPAGAVKLRGKNVEVNITPDTFVEIDPTRVHGDPATLKLVGAFMPDNGPNSYSRAVSGKQTDVQVQADGSTETRMFSGDTFYGSAIFVGMVGPCSISSTSVAPGGYAEMGFRKGTERVVVTTP